MNAMKANEMTVTVTVRTDTPEYKRNAGLAIARHVLAAGDYLTTWGNMVETGFLIITGALDGGGNTGTSRVDFPEADPYAPSTNPVQVGRVYEILLHGESHPEYAQAREIAEGFIAMEQKRRAADHSRDMRENPPGPEWSR